MLKVRFYVTGGVAASHLPTYFSHPTNITLQSYCDIYQCSCSLLTITVVAMCADMVVPMESFAAGQMLACYLALDSVDNKHVLKPVYVFAFARSRI